MCSYQQKSEDEPCSVTYPREVRVQRQSAAGGYAVLKCTTSCPLSDPQTAFRWYQDGHTLIHSESPLFAVSRFNNKRLSCAVKGHEDLLSATVCVEDESCWSVSYVSRRICALQGSSVNISSQYSYLRNQQPTFKYWYKLKQSGEEDAQNGIEAGGRVSYHDRMNNNHIMSIKELRKKDSAEYTLRLRAGYGEQKRLDAPGVTLVVTGLTVTMTPSAVVTEGQRVTLTCGTTCPLTEDSNYIWYLNRRPLTPPETQKKHLVLDPVSSHHAGNYSCAVKTHERISSYEKTLTVQAFWNSMAIINAVRLTVALLLPIPLLVFHLWLRLTCNLRTAQVRP
ncbi:uncharacterized protein LOC111673423 [Seriola lalandi dorsalis]|uniref:uncharacterized protein LOC111673423 n=1 Tax=Seriola lalandi dorsalis TaxID=1841481 RepID=UPI000C6FC2AC|nr:uncharacterized protein LOC111673423 [Seriola lalandi dorsalis]